MGVHDGHRARMKARFVRNGLDNFDDHSVLELLLFYAVPRRDVNELAHALLDHFGTLDAVFEASCEDMMRVPGVGENVATLLTLIPQVGRRYQMAKRRQQTILRSSEDAGNYLVPLYLYERTEVVYLLCLDAKCGLISCKEVGRGVVNAAEVSVRAIVETALSQKAVSVILSHNHVDAYALPSREDELTTRRIRESRWRIISSSAARIMCRLPTAACSESSPAAQILHFACQAFFQISRGCERFVLW